jgi:protein SCO1/2
MSPRFLPTAGAVAFLLAAGIAAAFHLTLGFRAFTTEEARRIRVAQAPLAVSPVDVIDGAGMQKKLWQDPGTRAWLVTFVYTDCPSICLAAGTEFQQMQASMSGDVKLASLSFDRARDTPEALAAYAKRFHADPARWLVAVPESDAALRRLLREMGVVAIDDGAGGYAHNAAIHIVTPSGSLVALFDLERHREALAFAQALAQ